MTLLAIVIIGQCLLLLAEEKRFLVYIRLAIFLCFYSFAISFFRI